METPKEWPEFTDVMKQIFDDLSSENELKKSKQAEFSSQANELKTSAKSETLYRKVPASERLPINENLIYSTDKGDLFLKDKRFHLKDGLLITKVSTVNYWLEEIPNPSAPEKEEMIQMLDKVKMGIKKMIM